MKMVMISIVEVDEHVWIHATWITESIVVTAYVIVKKRRKKTELRMCVDTDGTDCLCKGITQKGIDAK